MPSISKAMSDSAVAEAVYDQLETLRKHKGIKQSALAEQIGITPKTYRNLKTGSASFEVFISVLRTLDVLENLNDLLPDPMPSPIEYMKLMQTQAGVSRVRGTVSEGATRKTKDGIQRYSTLPVNTENSDKAPMKTLFGNRKKLKTKGHK